MDTRLSWFATLAVCTVTTPLFAWFTLNSTIPPSTTTAPAPIAILCHVFIRFPFELPLTPQPNVRLVSILPKIDQTHGGHRCPSNCLYPTYAHSGRNVSREVLLHFRGSGFKAGGLTGTDSSAGIRMPSRRRHSFPEPPFYVQNTRKERILVPPERHPR